MNKNITYLLFAMAFFAIGIYIYINNLANNTITVIHTVSYSNAVVFETIENNPERITRNFIPNPSQHIETLLAEEKKGPVVSVTPFANALIAASQNSDLRIIAGSGMNGLLLVTREAKQAADLKGKKIGTSRGDSLEVFAFEYMKNHDIDSSEYKFVYFSGPFEAIEAIKNDQIDAVTHVEPFATNLVVDDGMLRLASSQELWGDHPDAVILTTEYNLKRYKKELSWFISQLQKTEIEIKENPQETAERLASKFYQLPTDKLKRILDHQQPKIDIEEYIPFFKEKYKTLEQMRYVEGKIPDSLFDFSLLK